MKTTFKDVAHLYIGCETTQGKLMQIFPDYCLCIKNNIEYKCSLGQIKPLLRHIDNITIGEMKDIKNIEDDCLLKEGIISYAQIVRYCLDKKFDIYELIENNEAINILNYK